MRRFLFCICPLMICLVMFSGGRSLFAQSDLRTREVATGLDTPWEILWGPDNWIWMTERYGRISRINPETGELRPVFTIPDVREEAESGLLGMALHPDFQDTAHVFLIYTYPFTATVPRLRLVRYTYNGTTLVDPVNLLNGIQMQSHYHAGSRLMITPDRKLMVTLGELGSDFSQSRTSVGGKILRMNLDGTAPADNPWSTQPYPENLFWALGLRNPQGLAMGKNGIFYISEHGPSVNHDLNIVIQGRNYGWPRVTGKCDLPGELPYCASWNVAEPIVEWPVTLAVAGMEYYNHAAIPEWKNSLLMTTLKESDLRVLRLNTAGTGVDTQMIYFDNAFGRLRDVCVAPNGRVYIAVSNKDGRGTPKPNDDKIIEIRNRRNPWLGKVFPGRTTYTAGDTASVFFEAEGIYPASNLFIAQISDSAGIFGTPLEIGRVGSFDTAAGRGVIQGRIPCDLFPGSGYRIRVITANPGFISIHANPVTIRARAPIEISPPGPIRLCSGNSATLSAPSGYRSYLWSTGDTTRSITVHDSGTYRVTVTDSGDCRTASRDISVQVGGSVAELLIEPASATSFCFGDSVVLAASNGFRRYLWSTGDTSRSIIVRNSGAYSVTAFDSNNCVASALEVAVAVTYPSGELRIEPGFATSFCAGDSAVLTASGGYRGYLWSTGETTRSIVVKAPGLYGVTVQDTGECDFQIPEVMVIVHPLPVPVAAFTAGTLDAGDDYATYQWNLNGTPVAGATTRAHVPAISGGYTVTVTNIEGCTGTSAPVAVTLQGTSVPLERLVEGILTLSPRPAHETLTLTFTSPRTGRVDITVVDMNGSEVMMLADWKPGLRYTRAISLKGLAAGIYLVRITSARQQWTEKFVKE